MSSCLLYESVLALQTIQYYPAPEILNGDFATGFCLVYPDFIRCLSIQ